MGMLNSRQNEILDFVVRDFVKHGTPVSSGRVSDQTKIEAAPATIRAIMHELDEGGFLEQLHTSGGRVPTEKAYRYFVDTLMELKEPESVMREMLKEADRMMAHATKLFSVVADFGMKKRISFHGARELLGEPEFSDMELLKDFAGIFDDLFDVADAYRQELEYETEEAFIGKENPLEETRLFGAVAGRKKDKKHDLVFLVLGPRRMDYERCFSVVHYSIAEKKYGQK